MRSQAPFARGSATAFIFDGSHKDSRAGKRPGREVQTVSACVHTDILAFPRTEQGDEAEPEVIVPVGRIVPVAVRRPAVLRVVVPTATTIHTVVTHRPLPILSDEIGEYWLPL